MIQMISLAIPQNDIEVGQIDKHPLSYEDRRAHIDRAAYLERTCKDFEYRTKVTLITIERYFVIYSLSIAHGVKVDDILNLKSDFQLTLDARYLKFYVPTQNKHGFGIGIEIPNLYTDDDLLKDEIHRLTLPDFIFIKIYTMIVKSQVINTLYLSEELEISESRVKRYLKDMQKLNIISENGKFLEETDIDKAGYYWKRWRKCNL